MFDCWSFTIPANTAEADAQVKELHISKGVLKDLLFFMPKGCNGYSRCRVLIGEKSIAPRSAKQYIAINGYTLPLTNMNELITGNRPVLKWQMWNVDESYNHAQFLFAQWLSEEEQYEAKTYLTLKEMVELFRLLVGV